MNNLIWLYMLIYFLGAILTGLWVYILLIKKYLKENSALKFSVLVENYDVSIAISGLMWFIVLPISFIVCLISKIIERIHKHYNIE